MLKSKTAFLILFFGLFIENLFSQNYDSISIVNRRASAAQYPTGQAEMHKFIFKNLHYSAHTGCSNGLVFLNFCVEADGSISNIKIARGLCAECDATAIKVFSMMPKWKPAIDAATQKPIRSYLTVPCKCTQN